MESGASLAWTSPTLPYLKRKNSEIPISEIQGVLLVSMYFLGCLFGCLLSPWTMNKFGRKYSFLMFSMPVIIGWTTIGLATNYVTLLTARYIIGLGDGGLTEFISIYLGEITEKNIRGKLSIITKSAMLVGVFYENVVGTYLIFKIANLITISIPLLFVITFFFMPESPYIYVMRGQEKDAVKCLMKLRGFEEPESVQADMDVMKNAVLESQECRRNALAEIFKEKGNCRRLKILLIAKVTRHVAGSTAILTSLHDILKNSGNSHNAVLYVCAGKIAASLVSSQLIDRLGRRILFLSCGILCTISHGLLGIFFFFKVYLNFDVSSITWLPVVFLITFEIGYYMGLSPVGYVLQGELFPLKVKGTAVAIISVVEQFLSFLIGFGFPLLNHFLGIYSTFLLFSVCCISGTLLLFFNAPETKGKTLEEVESLIAAKTEKTVVKPLLIRSDCVSLSESGKLSFLIKNRQVV